MLRARQRAAFVPSVSRGQDDELIQAMLLHRSLRKRDVREMRRIECATIDANPSERAQAQSLGTRNFSYKSRSGVPLRGMLL